MLGLPVVDCEVISVYMQMYFCTHMLQVMAVATLERCYNNPKVFTGVVKIRKGETVRMIMLATNIDVVKAIFTHFVSTVSHSKQQQITT